MAKRWKQKALSVAAATTFALQCIGVVAGDANPEHPNRVPFRGVVTKVNEASDGAPHGTLMRRMMIPADVANRIAPTLDGMPVNFVWTADRHELTEIVGVIERSEIDSSTNEWIVYGYLFAKNRPDEVSKILSEKDSLGMSIELTNVVWENAFARQLVLKDGVATGAAILYKQRAAYTTTSLAASNSEDLVMEELLAKILAGQVQLQSTLLSVVDSLNKVAAGQAEAQNLAKELVPQIRAGLEKVQAGVAPAAPQTPATPGTPAPTEVVQAGAAVSFEAMLGGLLIKQLLGDKAGEGANMQEVAASALISKLIPGAPGVEAGVQTPVAQRKSLPYDAQAFVQRLGSDVQAGADGKYSVAQIDKALKDGGYNVSQQLSIKMALEAAGQL